MRSSPALACVGSFVLAGCAAQPPLTQTQIDALQVREVEVVPDAAFNALSNALLDSGYQVMVSDPDLRILTAQKRIDPAPAADAAVITGTVLLSIFSGRDMVRDLPPEFHAVSAVVGAGAPGRASVRFQTFVDGHPTTDQARVEELWVLVQRQVLMKEPASAPVR